MRQLARNDAADFRWRAIGHGREEDRHGPLAGYAEDRLNRVQDTAEVRAEPLARVDPCLGHVDHEQRWPLTPPHPARKAGRVILLSNRAIAQAVRHRLRPIHCWLRGPNLSLARTPNPGGQISG